MNSNLNNKKEQLIRELGEALHLNNDTEKISFERDKIQLDLMHLVSLIMGNKGWSKAELAQSINTSKAYISQLFSCDKKLNLETLAKIKFVSNARFKFELEEMINYNQIIEKNSFIPDNEALQPLTDAAYKKINETNYEDKSYKFSEMEGKRKAA